MTPDQFIENAISTGQRKGLTDLGPVQRVVWLISEAEVSCDMDGIPSLLARYDSSALREVATAFRVVGAQAIAEGLARIAASSEPDEALLSHVNDLITGRVGYDYDSIVEYVRPRA